MTHSITYISKAASGVGPGDVQDIWIASLENNEERELSGALYFAGDFFLHLLEGEEEDVELMFRNVAKDARHQDIVELVRNDLAAPMFRDSPMKFINGCHSPFLQEKFVYDQLVAANAEAASKIGFLMLKL